MAVRPIIFSAPMARSLLEGRKTQTRRVLKPQPRLGLYGDGSIIRDDYFVWEPKPGHVIPFTATCAYQWRPRLPYATGDRLWVREAWARWLAPEIFGGTPQWITEYRAGKLVASPRFKGDYDIDNWPSYVTEGRKPDSVSWKSPIHMPRKRSRLTLIVTDVRVQRVQEISEEDCEYEGAGAIHDWDCRLGYDTHGSFHPDQKCDCGNEPAQAAFGRLWDSLNDREPGCAWADNPWVVALTFAVHHQNIDRMQQEAA